MLPKGTIMPAAPRHNKQATKIHDDLLGVVENKLDKKTKKTEEIKKAILQDNTAWVR